MYALFLGDMVGRAHWFLVCLIRLLPLLAQSFFSFCRGRCGFDKEEGEKLLG